MNSFSFVGRLATDVEYENPQIGCVRFSVAVPRRWSKVPEQRKKADFICCKAYYAVGEFIKEHFNVGQEIACDAHVCSTTQLDVNGNPMIYCYAMVASVDMFATKEFNERYKRKEKDEEEKMLEYLNGGSDF